MRISDLANSHGWMNDEDTTLSVSFTLRKKDAERTLCHKLVGPMVTESVGVMALTALQELLGNGADDCLRAMTNARDTQIFLVELREDLERS